MKSRLLSVSQLCCRYGATTALRDVSFEIPESSLCCLLGPSGCGKSTILRAIAGFVPPHKGTISMNGRRLSDPDFSLPPEQRSIGMVFQDYALFPHLTAAENIAFGLQHSSPQQRQRRIMELLDLVQLNPGNIERYPHQLSGGEQQRLALARSLAPAPPLLLLDEPFSNLDADLRRTLNLDLKRILRQSGTSALLVTHDQEEGFAFADYMGVLQEGKICQWDTPYNLYHKPASRFIASFIGQGKFIRGQVQGNEILTAIGRFPARPQQQLLPGQEVDVLIRPDDIICKNGDEPKGAPTGCITQKIFAGDRILYTLELKDGSQLPSLMPSHQNYQLGQTLSVTTDLRHVITFKRN